MSQLGRIEHWNDGKGHGFVGRDGQLPAPEGVADAQLIHARLETAGFPALRAGAKAVEVDDHLCSKRSSGRRQVARSVSSQTRAAASPARWASQ